MIVTNIAARPTTGRSPTGRKLTAKSFKLISTTCYWCPSKNVSPCTGFYFWILAACGGSTDCPTELYSSYAAVWPASTWLCPIVSCMHACMTVTVNWQWIVTGLLSVGVGWQKKWSVYSGCTQRVGPPQISHMSPASHKEQIHPNQNFA